MMKALRTHTRGGPENLVYEDAPRPAPAAGEVLVEVHAAAVTFDEFQWPETWEDAQGNDRTPVIPAHEVSGVITAVGDGVDRFRPGDEVYGRISFTRNGAAAEYVAVETADLAIRPRTIGHVESAALPLAALTAWQALVDHAHLKADEHVLVLGGSGGVGVYAVQLAARLGAKVSATARGSDLQLVRELGADLAIDYRDTAAEAELAPADIVIDTVGGATLERSVELTAPGGRVITLGAPPPADLAAGRDATVTFFIVKDNPDQLAHIAALVDDGHIRPIVAQVYPLADGRAAYENGPQQGKPGKTVLLVKS
jgi:NADPH:quinone reductase-like Zn-dependent oxidoreductase